jgi:phosphate transport system protein
MERHFEKELERLKTNIIRMGSIVEEAIQASIRSLLGSDPELSRKVIDNDHRVNTLEIEIDNEIVDILALQQPVATDLRTILAAQTINTDLERIGDHAVNVAESALSLASSDLGGRLFEIPRMAEISSLMLRNALDSFIHQDTELAESVLEKDDLIDESNRRMTKEIIRMTEEDPKTIRIGFELIRVSRNLERVADLATNIAEEVIFLAKAKVVKHNSSNPAGRNV